MVKHLADKKRASARTRHRSIKTEEQTVLHLGELAYDGKSSTELTERQIMKQRAKQIASDPERLKKWDEYRSSALSANEG